MRSSFSSARSRMPFFLAGASSSSSSVRLSERLLRASRSASRFCSAAASFWACSSFLRWTPMKPPSSLLGAWGFASSSSWTSAIYSSTDFGFSSAFFSSAFFSAGLDSTLAV